MKFNIAVLGATGFIGEPYRTEIRECTQEARILSLCARREDLLRSAAKEDDAAHYSTNWQEAIEFPDVNMVLICTPDAFHYEALMACAEKGLHVLCEKPIGVNSDQAREMWEAYRQTQIGHFVPFWTRYVDVFSEAKHIVEQGTLGEIRTFVYRWHNPRPPAMPLTWRDDASLSSAGTIADVGSHAYDVVRWILQVEAKRVLAHGDTISPAKADVGSINLGEAIQWGSHHSAADAQSRRKGSTCDYASVSVEMSNGIVGSMVLSHATYLRRGVAPELELHGDDASLSLDRITGEVKLFRNDGGNEILATLPDAGQGNRFKKYVFPGLRAYIDGREKDYPDLEDGLQAQLFTDAVARSVSEGNWVYIE